MNGKYIGCSRGLLIAGIAYTLIYTNGWVFFEDLTVSAGRAAVTVALMMPGLIGIAIAERLPCRFTADEKSFTIITAGIKHRFRIGELGGISCEYRRHGSDKTRVILTVYESGGETHRFSEIHNADIAHIKYDDNTKKPQLKQLCEYVQRARGEYS